ncbi:hypothetical protein AX17_006418, partial [Amanita inopinata Kibby_2008]
MPVDSTYSLMTFTNRSQFSSLLTQLYNHTLHQKHTFKHQDALNHVINMGNNAGLWTGFDKEVIKIAPLQLILDVHTHWDSTFQMLACALDFCQPLNQLRTLDSPEAEAICPHILIDEEWERVMDIVAVLMHTHTFQTIMSKQKVPVLAGVIPSFKWMMTQLEKLSDKVSSLAPAIKSGLKVAYKYYHCMDETKAYVVAMYLHPAIHLTWISEHWGRDFGEQVEKDIKEIMKQYHNKLIAEIGTQNNMPLAAGKKTNLGYVNASLPSKLLPSRYDIDNELSWQNEVEEGL